MRKFLCTSAGLVFCWQLFTIPCYPQATEGRWALGIHGGGNLWTNDLNKLKPSLGGDIVGRYGVSRYFSLGLIASADELKSAQDPVSTAAPYPYLKLSTISAALVGYVHLLPRHAWNPYVYVGGGVLEYKRRTFGYQYIYNNKFHPSYVVPAGIGFDGFVSNSVAINVDLGYRNIGDWLDLKKNSKLDGSPTARAGFTFFFGSSDASDDDHDGLTNGEERRYGTDPENPDTDGDGLKDGEEVKRYRTNPLKSDTDGDGLSDGDEVMKYHTDPLKWDTDNDGLSDGDEVNIYHTDPLKWDTDGDGLSDGDEVLKYKTDPLKVDTDGDGLTDWEEVKVYHTDPLNPDTDGDGLSDGDEVKKYHTDPLKKDTDGGGVNDGDEIKQGTNPLDPRDDRVPGAIKLEKGKSVILAGIYFASGSANIAAGSEQVLEKAFQALSADPQIKVEIAGYTDNVGKLRTNERLSLRRAQSVMNWLLKRGIPAMRMTAIGRGPADPVAPNSTAEGRAQNRRIEFHVK